MIRAFLFDMDGVLAESEELSVSVGVSYFRSIGVNASSSDFSRYLGEENVYSSMGLLRISGSQVLHIHTRMPLLFSGRSMGREPRILIFRFPVRRKS